MDAARNQWAHRAILIVDSDPNHLRDLCHAFHRLDAQVLSAASGQEALSLGSRTSLDALILESRLSDSRGIDVWRALRDRAGGIPATIVTAYGSIADAVASVREGIRGYLLKPASIEAICDELAGERAISPFVAQRDDAPCSLAQIEWEHIHHVLSQAGGNVSEAARRLRIHRQSLQRKLRQHRPH